MMPRSVAIRLLDETEVGAARREARRATAALGFGEVAAERAAIVATEAARNVVLHARGGQLILSPTPDGAGLDVLALDSGPGIADVARATQDGYSTSGTAGHGLGAIARLSSVFDLYSLPGQGTVLLARVEDATPAGAASEAAGLAVAMAGEAVCGDGWAVERPAGRTVVLLADGLGHGAQAAAAAQAALGVFRRNAHLTATEVLEHVHLALRSTRGAAVAVAELMAAGDALRFAGIGNISGALVGSSRTRKMVSLPGTAGHEVRTIRSFGYEWPADDLLVMHTDGIATHWDLARYPGLARRHPGVVAGVLLRDFARGRDDATVVVARRSKP